MTRITLSALAVAALIGSSGLASAYDYNRSTSTPGIDKTESRQAREIETARRNGQLSWREQFALKREQRSIARLEADAKRDGVVTQRERADIREAQRVAQKHIDQAETNRERAGFRWWWTR